MCQLFNCEILGHCWHETWFCTVTGKYTLPLYPMKPGVQGNIRQKKKNGNDIRGALCLFMWPLIINVGRQFWWVVSSTRVLTSLSLTPPPSLPTPFHSALVSISALSTVFHLINSPDNFPFSHSVLSVISLCLIGPFNYISLYESLLQPWCNPLWLTGRKNTN